MQPNNFINQIIKNFPQVMGAGFIVEGEMRQVHHSSPLDFDEFEGLIMRLYFLSTDPTKEIKFFINQYAENRFLYYIKIQDEVWFYTLCENNNFDKLHFFIKYLLSDLKLDFESPQEELEVSVEEEKLQSAKRIQETLFPDLRKATRIFRNHHFWYSPKDIVGGDFYWTKSTKDHQWIIIGDCTGHSLEGALGTVSIISILNQVFNKEMNPHHLIKSLHKSLNNIQKQTSEGYGIGCEIMVMKFNRSNKTLMYSSTGMPLVLINGKHPKKTTLFKTRKATYEPDRVIKSIRSRTLLLKKGDGILTYSDGLVDQLNPNGKRLRSNNLLKNITDHGSVDQETIESFFYRWKHTAPQTDDVVCLYAEM